MPVSIPTYRVSFDDVFIARFRSAVLHFHRSNNTQSRKENFHGSTYSTSADSSTSKRSPAETYRSAPAATEAELTILQGMHLPTSFWACLFFLILTGLLCRKWPRVALYGAVSALCVIGQVLLRQLPSEPSLLLADALLFVLPSMALASACGMKDRIAVSIPALSLIAIVLCDPKWTDIRQKLLVLGVALAQSLAAVSALSDEICMIDRSLERRAAMCVAFIGLLDLGFVEIWDDVAWTGVAAHAFACLAYFVHQKEQKNDALPFAPDDGCSPIAVPIPGSEKIEKAEHRPDGRHCDPCQN